MVTVTDDEKPTPSVPPTDTTLRRGEKGSRILEREPVDTCDCGGTWYEEEIATGDIVIGTWDPETFDSDKFRLHTSWERTERRVRCDRCGAGWSF